VGGGYAVRGLGGLGMALALTDRPALAAAAGIALWAFGVAFVTSRWAVEALAFARFDGPRVTWSASAGQAREHLLALVRWLPAAVDHREAREPSGWAALAGPTAPGAPWNLAAAIAAAAAGVTGRLLAGPGGVGACAVAASVAAIAAVAVLAGAGRQRILALAGGAAGLALVLSISGSPRPLVGALPWLAVIGAYVFFTAQSLEAMARPLRAGPAKPPRLSTGTARG
jgi:hypothetical protein